MLTVTKNELATNVAAGSDQHRRALEFVCLNKDGLVSSDGYRLLIIPLEGSSELGDAEVLFSAEEAAQLSKGLRKTEALELDTAATLANGHVALRNANGTALAIKRETESRYPAYDQVLKSIRKEAVKASVSFNARLMAEICKALAGATPDAGVTIAVRDDVTGIELSCPSNGRKAVLMPMRV